MTWVENCGRLNLIKTKYRVQGYTSWNIYVYFYDLKSTNQARPEFFDVMAWKPLVFKLFFVSSELSKSSNCCDEDSLAYLYKQPKGNNAVEYPI